MADVPEGAELLSNPEVPWPVISVDAVHVLPGVPQIFASKLRLLRDRIGADRPFVSRAIYTSRDEGSMVTVLEEIVAAHPSVEVGSYPAWRNPEFRVKLTFDGLDAGAVDAALDACAAALGAADVVRTT